MYDKEDVKRILMERDGMDEESAQELVDEAQDEISMAISEGASIDEVEQIIEDYFGLEPDYLMDFLEF